MRCQVDIKMLKEALKAIYGECEVILEMYNNTLYINEIEIPTLNVGNINETVTVPIGMIQELSTDLRYSNSSIVHDCKMVIIVETAIFSNVANLQVLTT